MNATLKKYVEVLNNTNVMALATSVDNIPNVRVVNFYYNPEKPHILYFVSDRADRKVLEFAKNNVIAFTTIPAEGISHARSLRATVRKSALGYKEFAAALTGGSRGEEPVTNGNGELLDVYEIFATEAEVVAESGESARITF